MNKIKIPKETYNKLEKRIKESEFKSVNEYVTYILDQVLEKLENKQDVFSKEDEEKVQERLRSLGYLD